MTVQEADKIRKIWGIYLEYCFGRFNMLFQGNIPESLLPFPKPVLEEALNILDRHYFEQKDKHAMNLMRETSMLLELYHDDISMLDKAGKNFNNPELRKKIADSIKEWQLDWLKTQTHILGFDLYE